MVLPRHDLTASPESLLKSHSLLFLLSPPLRDSGRDSGTLRLGPLPRGVVLPRCQSCTVGYSDKDKTFRPTKTHRRGSKREQLSALAHETLGSGTSLHDAVAVPQDEDLNEWLAVHSALARPLPLRMLDHRCSFPLSRRRFHLRPAVALFQSCLCPTPLLRSEAGAGLRRERGLVR